MLKIGNIRTMYVKHPIRILPVKLLGDGVVVLGDGAVVRALAVVHPERLPHGHLEAGDAHGAAQ